MKQLFAEAFHWLCQARKKHPPSSDIWEFRSSWKHQANEVIEKFQRGKYQLGIQKNVTLTCGETIALWSSCDALIIKVLTAIVQKQLSPFLSKNCYHIKGNGGLKGAVRDVVKHLPKYKFFCKTDVKSYYASIDHYVLMMKLYDYIFDTNILNYIWQFLNRCVEYGGLYRDVTIGIPKGSSLSPLLGAFYLMDLDRKMEKLDVKSIRYMDDILILAPSRWKLKKAIRLLNQDFNELRLEHHPDKTMIGRIERGFDFLGYHFEWKRVCVSETAMRNFAKNAFRLYEHEPPQNKIKRLGKYIRKWKISKMDELISISWKSNAQIYQYIAPLT
jgi:RNA-directed DNA polymerase